MCSNNVAPELQTAVAYLLDVSNPLNTVKYLGLPFLVGRKKKVIFAHLKDRLWKRLQG